ncbi:MAG: hypothetical protein AB1586_33110 [Pseudomonadota bacterium]
MGRIEQLVEAAISLCEPENADEKATAYTREVLTRRFREILDQPSHSASCAGLTRASSFRDARHAGRKLDCRVKPGNDAVGGTGAVPISKDGRGVQPCP